MSPDAAVHGQLSALIADDEALARRRIVELLDAHPGVRVVAECANGASALEALRDLQPDILFLDVQMPGLTGFEVLARLHPDERPVVIFSTAYDEYALAAFDVHAVDYLLKPYADDRFTESLRRAEIAIRTRRQGDLHERLRALLHEVTAESRPATRDVAAPLPRLDRFAVRDGERLTVLEAASIDWIESAGDYVRIHFGTKSRLLRATLGMLERRLDPVRFLRIHRSTIVHLERVHQLQSDQHGEYVVLLKDGHRLRVGRTWRNAALARLGVQW